MPAGLDNLRHIVVLMMSGRSFDHMLGGLKAANPRINGLSGNETNPDSSGALVRVQPLADFQGQLAPTPDTRFPGVDVQIFGGPQGSSRVANMQGFIQNYYERQRNIAQSHKIMYYFTPDKLPVLATLATEFAVFNGWFSSIPGPSACNQVFAHYGTSFGQVKVSPFFVTDPILSIYERMIEAGRTAKIYYYDQASSTVAIANLLKNQPQIFATYSQFLEHCKAGVLPDYCFIEPNHVDHIGEGGEVALGSDQRPDHNIQAGELFIASVYNAIRLNPELWHSSAILIVYDQHGGIYDHAVPPSCIPDGYIANADATGTGRPFAFDRFGVRVPAVLVSPYIPRGTVVPGTEDGNGGLVFEHASIPGTVTNVFLREHDRRTVREKNANSFLGPLTDHLRLDDDCVVFDV